MDLNKFTNKRPYLYHLTDARNLPQILERGQLLSTKKIIELSNLTSQNSFLTGKRDQHTVITIDGNEYRIRDQQPISIKVLSRSLTANWTAGRFIAHLNKRVFFWPTLDRLYKHYNRYVDEQPVILRFNSKELLELNPNVEFCRLNSGATRCSSHWGGNAPERGPDTFLNTESYDKPYASVAEVTVPILCHLPNEFWTGSSPEGTWRKIRLNQ